MTPCYLCHGFGIAYVNKKDKHDGMEICPECDGQNIYIDTTSTKNPPLCEKEVGTFQVIFSFLGMMLILGMAAFWVILGIIISLSLLYELGVYLYHFFI